MASKKIVVPNRLVKDAAKAFVVQPHPAKMVDMTESLKVYSCHNCGVELDGHVEHRNIECIATLRTKLAEARRGGGRAGRIGWQSADCHARPHDDCELWRWSGTGR